MTEERFCFGAFELRPEQGELRRNGELVPLQRQPLKVLTVLASRAGELVPRSELIEEVWRRDTHVDFDRGLNFCIKQVRAALGDDASAPRFIETVPRYGYRFVAEVTGVVREGAERREPQRVRLAAAVAILVLGLLLGAVWHLSSDVATPRVVHPDAMAAFARGRSLAGTASSEDATEIIGHFERAVSIQPDFAEAHLALAYAWTRAPGTQIESAARARRAVLRALSLDDGLADGHALLASIKLYVDWDWSGADESYRRAVELHPAAPKLRHARAGFLSLVGRHAEAIVEIERAMALDPVSTAVKADAGWLYYQAGRTDDAVRSCELTLELDPANENALWCLVQAHRHAGEDAAALAAASRLALQTDPRSSSLDDLDAFWRWYLRWMDSHPGIATPTNIGLAHLALGERDRALELFEEALDQHLSCVIAIGFDPQLEPLRGEPRFERLLARLRLPSPPAAQ